MSFHPPNWPLRFLRWFCREDYIDEIEGDLVEMYYQRAKISPIKANLTFCWNVLRSLRFQNLKTLTMKSHYLAGLSIRQTFRYIRRERIYSVLNGISLSVGFALVILFSWYAVEETSFDQFHSGKDSIYRVSFDQYLDLGPYATTSYPIGPAIKKDFPEINYMSRFGSAGQMAVRFGNEAFYEQLNTADIDFFRMFDFKLIRGDENTVLDGPNKVVISEEVARKYFADEDPIGKQLNIGSGGSYDAEVTGVFKNIPSNSQLEFNILLSYATIEKRYSWLGTLWQQMPRNYTYIQLAEGTDPVDFDEKLGALKAYVKNLERGDYDLMLIPLEEVHFYEGLMNELSSNKDKKALVTFGLVVLFVLIIGLINFINITASRYMTRIKEMGIRKIMGAERTQLIVQLLFQSFWMVLFSLGLAWIIIATSLPLFNDLAAKNFELTELFTPLTILISTILLFISTLIAGITPSLAITAVVPFKILKSTKSIVKGRIGMGKSMLVIFQYAVAITLLISSIVIFRQLRFLEESIAPNTKTQLVIPINSKIRNSYDVLSEKLKSYPSIHNVAASSHVPSFYGDSWPVKTTTNATPLQTENFVITENYLDVMSYELLEGRFLDEQLESDVTSSFIVNETCVAMLGFRSGKDAIGKTIIFGSDNPKEGKIVGVAKDFHFSSFREKIEPALFQFQPYDWMGYNFMVLNVNQKEASKIIQIVEEEIAAIDPEWVVNAEFFDDHFKELHFEELQQGKLASVFSIVAIILSCLGQMGLLLNLIIARKKELAIRKVLGARVKQLWYLTTKTYLRFFLVGLFVGIPVAFYLMSKWLNGFYYHIEIGISPFIVAGLIAGVTLISIISVITLKAAYSNPTESLADE